VKPIKYSERGCIFRMGKFLRVVGPGSVFLAPIIDIIKIVNLDETILDWRLLCPQETNKMVKFLVLYYPKLPRSLSVKQIREQMEDKGFTG
jgi:regulator of protease activity HflC (stomatin/prohibitin superfamily)